MEYSKSLPSYQSHSCLYPKPGRGAINYLQLIRAGPVCAGITNGHVYSVCWPYITGLLSLPYIITTTEEALKSSQWYAGSFSCPWYHRNMKRFGTRFCRWLCRAFWLVWSSHLPGSRRTAPILFTGVAFYINGIPNSVNQEFMAFYHIMYICFPRNT